MKFANYHTHSTFCDGKDTPEAMVQEAVRLGCPALGFSGHGVAEYDNAAMKPEAEGAYVAEVRRLQEAYAGKLRILCGVEWDFYGPESRQDYDYVIGGVHDLKRGGEYRCLDWKPEMLADIVRDWFGGDWYAMAEEYYRCVGALYEQTGCRVIAHFDLIEKFNEDGTLFDRAHPRYRAAALGALERLKHAPVIFEINTGAMARGYRKTPYPDDFLLRAMQEAGVPLMLGADCHDKRFLLYGFAQYAALVDEASFTPEFLLNPTDGAQGSRKIL